MAPKKERDEALNDFSARIFASMLDELLMDVVLQSHEEIARSRSLCEICHTHCNSAHGSSGQTSSSDNGRPLGTPPTNGTDTPNGTVYFACAVCNREIASNRYAPHLSSCMNLGTSRRGAARNANNKNKPPDAGRSASPYLASESGHVSDNSKGNSKAKGKSRAKQVDDAEFSLNKKRNGSPSVSPVKKAKKQKTGSPVTRVKTDPDLSGSPSLLPIAHTNSHSKIPSRLRESSVLSSAQVDQRSTSPDSRESSPSRSVSTFSLQSPILPGAPPPRRVKPSVTASKTGVNRYTPPPPPIPKIKFTESEYFVDVEGEETGSSTDTESD